jgi:hypothetical protein
MKLPKKSLPVVCLIEEELERERVLTCHRDYFGVNYSLG